LGDLVQAPAPPPQPGAGQPVYRATQPGDRLWQGEILENVVQIRPTVESIAANVLGQLEFAPVIHELVVVMSQDCDLDQDYARRAEHREGTLPNIMLCDVYRAEVLRALVRQRDQLGSQDWRKRIAQNQNERFHYLQRTEPAQDLQREGLSALALDFKLYFTLPTDELYARLSQGIRRRCILNTPYAEHLAHRFFKFQSRVALPQDHQIDAVPD
jgi:hypothetical protein